MRRIIKQLLSFAIVVSGLLTSMQAGIIGNDQCLIDTSTYSGCTANDVGIAAVRVIGVSDGCVNDTTDTATIQVEVDITSGQPERYGVGIHIDLKGGDAVASGNTCVHEALFDQSIDNTDIDATSGIGPFLNSDDDLAGNTCGSVGGKVTYTRRIVQGDIVDPPPSSTQALDLVIACSDTTDSSGGAANGYVDFGWAVGWTVDKSKACTSISQAIADGPSKCQNGVQDTNDGLNPIPIGIPELTLTISCTPSGLKAGETTTCTVDYANANNANTGPADFIEFHLDYNETYGGVDNFVFAANPSGNDAASDTGDYINWIIDANQTQNPKDRATLANIPKNTSGQFTFDYTVNGGYDGTVRAVDFVATAFFNNDGSTGVEQGLTASDTVYLPVTVNYAYPRKNGDMLEIDFSTASETGNLGFNIYAIKGKKWTKLNREIIPGSLDSFEPKDYYTSVELPDGMKIKKIGISGIDISGKEDRHGPFKIGKESGSKSKAVKVDWKKVNKQVKADKKARKAAKKAARKATKQALKDKSIVLNVSQNAVYRVTHDDLLAQGIDLRGQKAKKIAISFRSEGIARHIEGLNKKKRWTKNSWIEFVGTKPSATDALYVDSNRYRLSLNRKRVVDSDVIEPMTTKEIIIDKNNRYSYSTHSDDPFYEGYLITRNQKATATYTSVFDMPVIPEEGTSSLRIDTYAFTEGTHHMRVTLNGLEIANTTAEDRSPWIIKLEAVDNNIFRKIGNELIFSLSGESDGADMVVYDKMLISYNDGEKVPSLTPAIEITDKISKKDIKAKRGINYVMIVHPLFMGETLDLYVKQRKGEGWNIKVVNVEDIYAAYDNGMVTPTAIKSYLKDAIKRGVTHVQLVGAASYDYHDYLGLGSVSFIPSLYAQSNEYIKYTPCDACYVMGKDGLPAIAIGRWPVRTLDDLDNVVNKTLAWQSSGQGSNKTALLIADKTDAAGSNFSQQLETMADKMTKSGWSSIERVYLDEIGNSSTAHTKIMNTFSEGPSVLAYNGHAATSTWSFSRLLHQSDIASLNNSGKTAIALPFACNATFADSPYINTMAHQLLAEGENGAVAVYGAATMCSFGDNGVALGKVLDGLMARQTLGEAVKNAKHSLGASYRDVIRNGNLIGDVTLELK